MAAGCQVAVNFGTVEEVLAQQPDLVLAGIYTTPGARMLLKKLSMPLLEVAPAANFDEIRATTRLVAKALGREALGEALIAKMDLTLLELDATKPPRSLRVAAWGRADRFPARERCLIPYCRRRAE